MKQHEIGLVLLTKYPNWYVGTLKSISDTDKIRGDLALESIRIGIDRGFQLVVSDGESNKEFLDVLDDLPVTIINRKNGTRGDGRRQGFTTVSSMRDVKVIVRTEPEKIGLVKYFIKNITYPLLMGEADIVVPKRNAELFKKTYPSYMYKSEFDLTEKYNEKLLHSFGLLPQNQYLDLFFGPIAFCNNPKILDLFQHQYTFTKYSELEAKEYSQPDEYSNGHVFPVIEALFQSMRVKSVEIDFIYPYIQKENEEIGAKEQFIEKRRKQKIALLDEGIHFIRYLLSPDNHKVGIKKVENRSR